MEVKIHKEGKLRHQDVNVITIELANGSKFRMQEFGDSLKIIATDEMNDEITIRPIQANVVMVSVSK